MTWKEGGRHAKKEYSTIFISDMIFKKGVKIFGMRSEMIWAAIVVEGVYDELGNSQNCVITSGIDGIHKRSSEHYKGDAIDVRVWGFDAEERAMARDMIDERLTDEFEVFDEEDHLHIGFDPQTGINQ